VQVPAPASTVNSFIVLAYFASNTIVYVDAGKAVPMSCKFTSSTLNALKAVQSADDNAPLFVADAVGKLKL